MSTTTVAIMTNPTREMGRLARFWKGLIAIDQAIHFDPIENLEKRVRAVEDSTGCAKPKPDGVDHGIESAI